MEKKEKIQAKIKTNSAKKNEGNNQWISTGLTNNPDSRERRDGPGGENGKEQNIKRK